MSRLESSDNVAAYVHGGRIGVLVEVKGGDADLARGIAMHVAAMNPPYNKAADDGVIVVGGSCGSAPKAREVPSRVPAPHSDRSIKLQLPRNTK